MMKARFLLLCGTVLCAASALTGCKDKSGPEEPYLTTDPAEVLSLDAGSVSEILAISTNQTVWNFVVEDGKAWCTVSRGTGNTLTVRADHNRADAERTAIITLTAGTQDKKDIVTRTVTVRQAGTVNRAAQLLERAAYYEKYPTDVTGSPAYSVSSEAIKLEFYGWGESNDKLFTLNFPDNTATYNRAILKYRMGAWNEGCSSYDNTTMFFVRNKADGEWYEIARAMTPFGNSFGANWERYYYFDVTDYLPMLQGATEFRVYYGGFDATATRAHTATLTFDLYAGTPARSVVYYAKVYDSSRDGNSGYRAFSYGVSGHDIEAAERLGEKTFTIPAQVKSLEMKVTITGHGHDQGSFPNRTGYRTKNAAEFDENTYTVKINGTSAAYPGTIFVECGENYSQAGTYSFDRANWCPGNPAVSHYWKILGVPQNGGRMTVDFDLEKFISSKTAVNAEGVAQYIVEADLFGFDK